MRLSVLSVVALALVAYAAPVAGSVISEPLDDDRSKIPNDYRPSMETYPFVSQHLCALVDGSVRGR